MSSVVFSCPKCGKSYVEYSSLVGGSAKCNVDGCGWTGTTDDLLATPMPEDPLMSEGIPHEMTRDFNNVVGELATPIGVFLSRWGFIDVNKPKTEVTKDLTEYVKVCAKAMLKAVIEHRVSKEKVSNVR